MKHVNSIQAISNCGDLEDDSTRMAEWRSLCFEKMFADMIEEVAAKHIEIHKNLFILYLASLNGLFTCVLL